MHEITITGVPPDHPGVIHAPPCRLDITDLIKDRKQFSLYIQATQKLFSLDQNNLVSFFAMGGIHGLPYKSWDQSFGETTQDTGYCTHGSNLFPTWHRAYVALFEQELQRRAADIAKEYKEDCAEWIQAAATLRSPFWDWAHYKTPPDEVIRMKTIDIITPRGVENVKNPLYGYTFNPIDPSFQGIYANDPTTVRWPNPPESHESQPDSIVEALQGYDARTNIYKMMTLIDEWPHFSNHTYDYNGSNPIANSLEAIHDTIHGCLGGGGHMGDIPYAAFDPIFWIHHTQVDRLLALWQTIHYDIWVSPQNEPMQTYTIPPNSYISEDTDLTPFWNGATTFWKSSDVPIKDWTQLNYEYPDFVNLRGLSASQRRLAIIQRVALLYGPTLTSTVSGAVHQVGALAAGASQTLLGTSNIERADMVDWFVRVHSGRFALGGSYWVLLFIGEPPASSAEWRKSPKLLGVHTVFATTRATMCANCQSQKDNIDEGFVHISERLEKLGLWKKAETDIEKYLHENLRWRIQKLDGTVVAAETVAKLEVAVMTVPLKWSAELGVHIRPKGTRPVHRNILKGLPGGRGVAAA